MLERGIPRKRWMHAPEAPVPEKSTAHSEDNSWNLKLVDFNYVFYKFPPK